MSPRVPVGVFVRPPRPGEVKTRLARRVGPERAAALAAAFLADVWAVVSSLPWARPVLVGTESDVAAYGLGPVELWLQGDGDLGARMERTLLAALTNEPAVLLIGADLPALPAAHLEAARAALTRHEVVLGPADDGGFWLIGARRFSPGALAGLTWSTASTRAQTETALICHGLDVGFAPAWFDVDDPEDLDRLEALVARAPEAAPRTAALLRRTP